MSRPGGLGEERVATPEVQRICDEVKSHAEVKVGRNFNVFTAKLFKTQVVAGTNFFIKVHIGEDQYIHVRVYRMLPHAGEKLELHDLQTAKCLRDPIEYF